MSALLSTLAMGLVIPFNLAPAPQEPAPEEPREERVRTVHERREGSDTLLFSDAGAPPIRLGAFAIWGTLDGKIEKENSSTGLGSGGDKLKMQTDLNFDEWSPLYGLEFIIEADSNMRLRAAVFGSEIEGQTTATEFHRHDGNLFSPGDRITSRFSYGFGDLAIHFLPRQQNRVFNELDISIGVRAFNFKTRLRNDSGLSVTEYTAGAYPRFAMRGLIGFGRGIYLHLQGAIGGWAMGGPDSYYTVADFELNALLGVRVVPQLEFEGGYWFQTFGTYQESHGDLEQVSFNRHGVKAAVRINF